MIVKIDEIKNDGISLKRFVSVSSPYDPYIIESIKKLSYRKYIPERKSWVILSDELGKFCLNLDELGHQVQAEPELMKKIELQKMVELKITELKAEKGSNQVDIPGIKKPLFAYQAADVGILTLKKKILNANEMGTGKTVECIAGAVKLFAEGKIKKVLIVTPKSIQYMWGGSEEEGILGKIQEFSNFSCLVIDGSPKKRMKQYQELANANFVAITYGLVRKKEEKGQQVKPNPDLEILKAVKWDLVILDEMTAVKGYKTQQCKGVIDLVKNAEYVWGLTGTPLLNRLSELHNIIKIINPDYLPWWGTFAKIYLNPNTNEPRKDQLYNLNKRLQGIMVRRTKEEVLDDLPEKLPPIDLYLGLSEEQYRLYMECLEKMRIDLSEDIKSNTPDYLIVRGVLAQMIRLKQICVHPGLLDLAAGNNGIQRESCKLDEIKRLLDEELLGKKVVIFTQFEKFTHILEEELRDRGGILKITGAISAKERTEAEQKFQNDPNYRIMLLTTAGGLGITLTAANYIIIVDQLWTPGYMDQVIDRLHRIGQKNPVTPIWLWIKNSIERKIWQTLERKRHLIDEVIEGNIPKAPEKLTLDDVKSWLGV